MLMQLLPPKITSHKPEGFMSLGVDASKVPTVPWEAKEDGCGRQTPNLLPRNLRLQIRKPRLQHGPD
jgi:hypothetical protein